jgi:hypothetical protein
MAKADKELKASVKKIQKPLVRMNTLFNDIMDTLSNSNTNTRDRELTKLTKDIDDVIFQEIQGLTKFTGDDISTFLVKLFNDQDVAANVGIKDIDDIFENESNGLFTFFKDRYRNQNLLYEDLSVITSQLYELNEALLATRDAVVTSDEMSTIVSRTLRFKNSADTDVDKKSYIQMVESLEKQFKLLQKIKAHIIPNTLEFGRYYVYTVPYKKLFQKHYEKIQKQKNKTMSQTSTMEGVDESFAKDFKNEWKLDSAGATPKKIKESFDDILLNIEIINDEEAAIPVVEGTELSGLIDVKFEKQVQQIQRQNQKQAKNITSDGTVDVNTKEMDFSNVKDCYIKLIDPRKIIPIKVLDETIGYYYIHEEESKVAKSPFTTNIKLSAGSNVDPKDVETSFLSKITDKIIKGFDKKFLDNNMKFKELILNSLIYNDVYKKKLKFQFIPVDQITEFAVNLDEDGNGTSIILPSLFYAKLYLALLIFKMITIISKSNDQKVYYVKQSGIDNNVANKLQDVARSIKDKQINFMDLMNYNNMVSKIGAAKDIFMPVGRSGERGIEFDVIAGQDVQINNELMTMLHDAFINATGVPSVIMNYINEADYAKTLVMANAKFQNRVVSYQMDFNPAISELYKKIMLYATDIPEEVVDEFEFILSTPKSLDTANIIDMVNNTDQLAQFMIKTITGEQAPQTDEDNLLKDIVYKKIVQELLPMLPWANSEKIYEDSKVDLQKALANKKGSGDDGTAQ